MYPVHHEAGTLDAALHNPVAAPDVVLPDIYLRGLNGLDGITLPRRKWPLVQCGSRQVKRSAAGSMTAWLV